MRGRWGQRRMRRRGATPVEEAPLPALAVLVVVLWLVAFPAVVGVLAGLGAWSGSWAPAALGALALALVLVAGAALQKPWRRPAGPSLEDRRPLFIRFSTWLITALVLPNVIFGLLVLGRPESRLGYREAAMLGLLVSLVHATWALVERWRPRRSRRPDRRPDARP